MMNCTANFFSKFLECATNLLMLQFHKNYIWGIFYYYHWIRSIRGGSNYFNWLKIYCVYYLQNQAKLLSFSLMDLNHVSKHQSRLISNSRRSSKTKMFENVIKWKSHESILLFDISSLKLNSPDDEKAAEEAQAQRRDANFETFILHQLCSLLKHFKSRAWKEKLMERKIASVEKSEPDINRNAFCDWVGWIMRNGKKFVRLFLVDHSLRIGINYHLIAACWRFSRWKQKNIIRNSKFSATITANYFYSTSLAVKNLHKANPLRPWATLQRDVYFISR